MNSEIPFFKTIPYRNIILDLTLPPFPQENGESWTIENRAMYDYDLFICESGNALFTIDGTNYRLKPGMGLLVPPGCMVNARKTSLEPVRMMAQHFMLYLFHRTDFFSHIKYRNLVLFSNQELILSLVNQVRKIIQDKGNNWTPLDTSPYIMLMLREFIEAAYVEQNIREERKSHLVLQMITQIDREFKNPLLMEKLMDSSPFGYSHTANIFKDYTGRAVKTYIIERRMEAGKDALIRGMSVAESAEVAGYEDGFYFSRLFKKYTGSSPREFRKMI